VLIAAQRVGAQHHLPKRCINRRSRPLEPQRYRRRRPGSVTQNGRDWCQGSSSSMRCEPYNLRAADNDAAILLTVCEDRDDWHALAVFDALRDALNAAGIAEPTPAGARCPPCSRSVNRQVDRTVPRRPPRLHRLADLQNQPAPAAGQRHRTREDRAASPAPRRHGPAAGPDDLRTLRRRMAVRYHTRRGA
jgi:hypothetical protein